MKRFLCPKHIHHLKKEGKSVELSTEKCSICKWNKRIWTLADLARQLEDVASSLRESHRDPYYDPFGYGYVQPLQEVIREFIRSMHIDYRKNFIKGLTNEEVN